MDDELVRIVATAAAGLVVRAVSTAGWQRIRGRMSDVFGRARSADRSTVTAELDSAANTVLSAQAVNRPDHVKEVEHELGGTFRAWLRGEPHLLDDLRAIVEAEDGDDLGGCDRAQIMTVHDGIGLMSGRDTRVGSMWSER